MRGYSVEEALAQSLEETLSPAAYEVAMSALAEELAPEKLESGKLAESRTLELEETCKDGSTVLTEDTVTLLLGADGRPTALLGVTRDITERKRAEEALKESEEKYRELLENISDIIYTVNRDGVITYVSPAVESFVGYVPSEVIGRPFSDLIYPEDLPHVKQNFEKVIAGHLATNEYRLQNKSGEIRWIRTSSRPIVKDGQTVGLQGALADITDRKRAEEALKESEQKFRSLVETTSDWVWEINRKGVYTYANPKVKDILGYEPEEVIGKKPFDFMPPEEANQLAVSFREIAEAGRPFANLENTNIHKNGRHVVLETSGIPIFDESGALSGYRGIDRDITWRKWAEEALKESEERYRNMFWEAPDIFYVLDLETWMIIDANRHALETLEYGPEKIGNVHISEIVHPDDYERCTNRLQEMVIKKDRMPDFPLRILTRTGKIRHIEQNGVIFWDEHGKAKSFLGLAHDVTEHKKQEEMIRERNEKLAALYEVARAANESLDLDAILEIVIDIVPPLTDSDAICIYTFDEAEQVLSYRAHRGFPEEFIRETDRMKLGEGLHGYVGQRRASLVMDNVHDHPILARHWQTNLLGIDSVIIVPLVARDKLLGTLTVARNPGKPYDSEDLDLVTALANQIAVAMENANLYAQILQREAHLQSILETSRDAIGVISEEGRFVYRNSAASSLFGYSEDVEAHEYSAADFFAPESYPVLQGVQERLSRGRQIEEIVEFKGKREDGTMFEAEARIGHFFDNGKRYDVAVTRDVTERKRMEFQLQQSNKLAAIGELASGVAHEINNPIATIDVQTGLMREIVGEEREKLHRAFLERLENYLHIVEDQMGRCQSVTSNLLSFSRRPEGRPKPSDVNVLLKKTVELVVSLTDKKPEVRMVLDERCPLFRCDPNQLEQVFVNLLNNALKAVDSDGVITIVTRLDENGNSCIEFRDTGPGIPPEIKDRIFDPFFTTRSTGEGTGLGLSISYYILNQMNGKLDVDSQPGQGAVFTITLPGQAGAMESADHAS
jgi:PAS domain S-box-containing protein